jgi:hypothetical protein
MVAGLSENRTVVVNHLLCAASAKSPTLQEPAHPSRTPRRSASTPSVRFPYTQRASLAKQRTSCNRAPLRPRHDGTHRHVPRHRRDDQLRARLPLRVHLAGPDRPARPRPRRDLQPLPRPSLHRRAWRRLFPAHAARSRSRNVFRSRRRMRGPCPASVAHSSLSNGALTALRSRSAPRPKASRGSRARRHTASWRTRSAPSEAPR